MTESIIRLYDHKNNPMIPELIIFNLPEETEEIEMTIIDHIEEIDLPINIDDIGSYKII